MIDGKMIVPVTQELIDRLQHNEDECRERAGSDVSGKKPHFPCLIETAMQMATGESWSFTPEGVGHYKFPSQLDRPGVITPSYRIDVIGRDMLRAFDRHKPITPGSFIIEKIVYITNQKPGDSTK